MQQYLSEVMERVSTPSLSIMLAIIVACLIITIIREGKSKPVNNPLSDANCPTCGQEMKS